MLIIAVAVIYRTSVYVQINPKARALTSNHGTRNTSNGETSSASEKHVSGIVVLLLFLLLFHVLGLPGITVVLLSILLMLVVVVALGWHGTTVLIVEAAGVAVTALTRVAAC